MTHSKCSSERLPSILNIFYKVHIALLQPNLTTTVFNNFLHKTTNEAFKKKFSWEKETE